MLDVSRSENVVRLFLVRVCGPAQQVIELGKNGKPPHPEPNCFQLRCRRRRPDDRITGALRVPMHRDQSAARRPSAARAKHCACSGSALIPASRRDQGPRKQPPEALSTGGDSCLLDPTVPQPMNRVSSRRGSRSVSRKIDMLPAGICAASGVRSVMGPVGLIPQVQSVSMKNGA